MVAVNLFYGELFELWKTQLPGIGADGAKNYYTLAYHIVHDASSWWFDGMNYPTGEHLMFTDNQPLIANTLKWLDSFFPIAENLHWLLPIFTFISFWIAALIIGNLVTKTGIHHALTAIISVGIVLLSPQLIRLSGHYSLSYAFVIPLVFALCYQLFLNWNWKTAGVLMLSLFLSGFIHPYLLAMSSLFVLLFFLTRTMASSDRNNWMEWMKAFAISIGPLILFQVVLKITDPVEDRPEAPYGFLIYRATLSSLFMPTELWYMNPIKAVFPFLFKRAAEGGFYLGLFSIAGTIWGLISLFRNGISNVAEYSTLRKFTLITLLASIPIALLSVGIPLLLGPLESS